MLQKKNLLMASQCPENKAYLPSPICKAGLSSNDKPREVFPDLLIYRTPGTLLHQVPSFSDRTFYFLKLTCLPHLGCTLHHNLSFDLYPIPSSRHVTFIESIISE